METDSSSRKAKRQERIQQLRNRVKIAKAKLARHKNASSTPAAVEEAFDADLSEETLVEESTSTTGSEENLNTHAQSKNNRCPPGANSLYGEECRRHVEEKMRNGMSRKEARLDWIQARVSARIAAKKQAREAAKKAAAPADEKKLSAEDTDPRTDMTLRETAGMRVPLPARMVGETAEAYERRELQAAEDFIAGRYDEPDEEEKSKEERRVIRVKRRVRWQIHKQVHPELREIDWRTVVNRNYPRWKAFPEEMLNEQPTPRAAYAATTLDKFDKNSVTVHGYPWGYLAYIGNVLWMIDNPEPLEDIATARDRIKLAYLKAQAAKITEDWEWAQPRLGGAALKEAGDETRFKLQMLQELANPMARAVWDAARERDYARGRGEKLVYREGVPVDLRAPMPRLVEGKWKTRRGKVCLWSPCLQCKVAGAGECSSARFLPRKVENRVCHRCRREGLPCVRGDDDSSEESLAERGVQRWETYKAADTTSMTTEQAQAIARELLETRGRKLLNVCGVMVDVEDAKRFAPAPEKGPNISAWQHRQEEKEEEEKKQKGKWVSKAEVARGDEFAERMKSVRCDEYWQEKASTGERVMMEFDGVTRRFTREDDGHGIPPKLWAI